MATKSYRSRIKEGLYFKLTDKVGALLGAGIGFLTGVASYTGGNIIENLSRIPSEGVDGILLSLSYGIQNAGRVAVIGAGVGYLITKFYIKKVEELEVEEYEE